MQIFNGRYLMHKRKKNVLTFCGQREFARRERTASRRNVRRLPEINLTSGRRHRRKNLRC